MDGLVFLLLDLRNGNLNGAIVVKLELVPAAFHPGIFPGVGAEIDVTREFVVLIDIGFVKVHQHRIGTVIVRYKLIGKALIAGGVTPFISLSQHIIRDNNSPGECIGKLVIRTLNTRLGHVAKGHAEGDLHLICGRIVLCRGKDCVRTDIITQVGARRTVLVLIREGHCQDLIFPITLKIAGLRMGMLLHAAGQLPSTEAKRPMGVGLVLGKRTRQRLGIGSLLYRLKAGIGMPVFQHLGHSADQISIAVRAVCGMFMKNNFRLSTGQYRLCRRLQLRGNVTDQHLLPCVARIGVLVVALNFADPLLGGFIAAVIVMMSL